MNLAVYGFNDNCYFILQYFMLLLMEKQEDIQQELISRLGFRKVENIV